MKRRISHRTRLSADAKLIIALLRKQPQKKDELCKSASIHPSTFYRIKPLLEEGIIKETKEGFALWTYLELEKAVEDVIVKLEEENVSITINRIASKVGSSPSEIEKVIFPIAKKLGMTIRVEKGEKVIARDYELAWGH